MRECVCEKESAFVCVCVCVCVREREREREIEKEWTLCYIIDFPVKGNDVCRCRRRRLISTQLRQL